MSGPFAAAAVFPDPQAPVAPAGTIAGDGFWPALDLDALRKAIRVDGAVTPERLRDVAVHAVLETARELRPWREQKVSEGYADLAEVPGDGIGGESSWVILWRRAVHSAVAADLAERQLAQSLRAAGADRAQELESDVETHRRNYRFAVRDFLGRSRIIAEAL